MSAASPRPWRNRFLEIVLGASEEAVRISRQHGGACRVYAVFHPSNPETGTWGSIAVGLYDDVPSVSDGFLPVTPEPFPNALPYDSWAGWLLERARRIPILGSDDAGES